MTSGFGIKGMLFFVAMLWEGAGSLVAHKQGWQCVAWVGVDGLRGKQRADWLRLN